MKRSYLAVAFLFLGVIVGAHMITPAPGATASPPVASEAKKAQPAALAPRAQDPVPTARTAAIARPPVPLLLSPRPAIKKAEEEMAAPQVAASDASQTTTSTQNESFAKAAIEQDGYKSVRGLAKGPNGSWRAMAMRGTTEVILCVDANGNVSAQ
jgi:hypothetical protein